MGRKKFWRYILRHAERPWDAIRLVRFARTGSLDRPVSAPVDFLFRFEEGRRVVSLREGTTDIDVFTEIFRDRIYAPPPGFQPRTIVDIGGNIGIASLYFSLLHPEARVEIFEPVPENLAILRRNVEQNGLSRIGIHPFGMGAGDGELTLSAEAEGKFGSFSASRKEGAHPIRVPIRDAGAAWDELGLDRVDLLKIDCEGAEVDLLRSLGDRLERVEVLIGELHADLCDICEAIHLLSRHHQVDFEKAIGQSVFPFRASRRPWDAYAS